MDSGKKLATMETDEKSYYTTMEENGIVIEIKKLGTNSRRIRAKIVIDTSFDVVWNVINDFEKYVDFTPSVVKCDVVQKNGNITRISQIAQKNLPLGLKIKTKVTFDCYAKDEEILASGRIREVDFKMIDGDFQTYEGKYCVQQLNEVKSEDSDCGKKEETETITLTYFVDVKPKLWLPVNILEGIITNEIKANLSCIREEANTRFNQDGLHQ